MESMDRLYKQLDRLEDSLDRLVPELAAIKTDLAYHIQRTDLLEARLTVLDKDVTKLHGFFSIGGWLVAIVATILTILNHFKVL